MDKLDLDELDFLFVENVGNLVCPADFPLGTDQRMVVISVTEGDDMVRKHPMIFLESDIAVLNKIDLLPYMDIDVSRVKRDYASRQEGGPELLPHLRQDGRGAGRPVPGAQYRRPEPPTLLYTVPAYPDEACP